MGLLDGIAFEKLREPDLNWDSVARRYVEHDTLPQETFGPGADNDNDRMALTQARLREVMHYDPGTGIFTRLKAAGNRSGNVVAGSNCGEGYLKIQVDGKRHRAHRLAWLYVYGAWPTGEIDHINGDKSDNRIANLREATTLENSRNRPRRRDNTTGYKGVSFHGGTGKYRAKINYDGKEHSLGLFETPEQAHEAYICAANSRFGQFARAA